MRVSLALALGLGLESELGLGLGEWATSIHGLGLRFGLGLRLGLGRHVLEHGGECLGTEGGDGAAKVLQTC